MTTAQPLRFPSLQSSRCGNLKVSFWIRSPCYSPAICGWSRRSRADERSGFAMGSTELLILQDLGLTDPPV